ncbi:hypothetical protein [Nostoc sp. DedSLP03]|uniref:hypothetical protein n=1 Tax=Nostoc sp. DedSLP03 TaxID=3075400 RepID=UPI002AD282DF|nr:hypothetical protein [Nostoc sp. DedSLP03]
MDLFSKSFITMSESIFQHLVNSVDKDYQNTYAYVDKNFNFIRQLTQKIANHIGCNLGKDIYLIDEEGSKLPPFSFIQDAILVDNECFFSFKLVISVKAQGFNINNSGRSFYNKALVPPSGIILYFSIKQEDDIFIVKAPSIKKEETVSESFKINSDDSSWTELLESVGQVLIHFSKKDLKYRISQLSEESSEQTKPFGFSATPETKVISEPPAPLDNNDV